MSRAGSTYLFFSSWSHSPFCLQNGQWVRPSKGVFQSEPLECWWYSCLAVSVIRHNPDLSPRPVDHKPGTLFVTQIAIDDQPGTRRRSNSAASSERLLVLFCPTSILRT